MTTKFNRILFDYDGTLIIHDKENEARQIAEILKLPEERIPDFEKRLNRFFETSCGREHYENKPISYGLYIAILNAVVEPKSFGITPKQLDKAINEKSKYGSKIEPTAIETLEYLVDKGYQLCIFTNGFLKPQVDNMRHHGLFDYFERVYAWDDFYAKPDERALIRALGGTAPENNVVVGDSLINDIAPAKAFGVYTVGINIFEQQEADISPDVRITTLSELKTFL